MATWAVQRAGNFALISSDAASPWEDGGAQAALASIPQSGDTITNAGAFSLTFTIDLPGVANVLDSDTVYGVAGTFNEAARNTSPGAWAVRAGVTWLLANATQTGTGANTVAYQEDIVVQRVRNGAKQ